MLTNNGRKWLGSALANKSVSFKQIDGEMNEMPASIMTHIKIVIGTGSTVETADDYRMESEVADGVKRTMWDRTLAGDNYIAQYMATFTNTTEKSVTVKEIGLTEFYSDTVIILLFRKTIEPVKIPAGGIKTFAVALL